MALTVAILAKDEAGPDRFLQRVITRSFEFADRVCLLDDRSTDKTPELATDLGCVVKTRSQVHAPAWGHEWQARAELWDFAASYCPSPNDWILFADADMVFVGDPKPLIGTKELNAWSFILYDVWGDGVYRSDGYWQGHKVPRPWMVAPRRVPAGWEPRWHARGLHSGHLPANYPLVDGIAPPDEYHFLHLAYSTPELRQRKHSQYLSRSEHLNEFEIQHARSILDA